MRTLNITVKVLERKKIINLLIYLFSEVYRSGICYITINVNEVNDECMVCQPFKFAIMKILIYNIYYYTYIYFASVRLFPCVLLMLLFTI